MQCFCPPGDISTPKDRVMVTNAKPVPEVEWKTLSDYRTHNS